LGQLSLFFIVLHVLFHRRMEADVAKLLAAQAHIGTKNVDAGMSEYVWRRRIDGVHILNVASTLEKLKLAARAIVTVEAASDICVVSARPHAQRAVLKFAKYTGAQSIEGRFTAGTFTNQITAQFKEPRVLIVTDPRTDFQPIKEASYVNIPVIAFTDSDSPLAHVDIAIPCNNKGKLSIGLMYWLLAREVLRMRGTIAPTDEWDIPVDLFFYKDPEDIKVMEEQQAAEGATGADGFEAPVEGEVAAEYAAADYAAPVAAADFAAPPAGGSWDGAAPPAAPAGADASWGAAPAGGQWTQ
jgi:small subunit ribosomal protein SAe